MSRKSKNDFDLEELEDPIKMENAINNLDVQLKALEKLFEKEVRANKRATG